jgi:hypothetical protein
MANSRVLELQETGLKNRRFVGAHGKKRGTWWNFKFQETLFNAITMKQILSVFLFIKSRINLFLMQRCGMKNIPYQNLELYQVPFQEHREKKWNGFSL